LVVEGVIEDGLPFCDGIAGFIRSRTGRQSTSEHKFETLNLAQQGFFRPGTGLEEERFPCVIRQE
jgi:hypothetical protein